MAAEEIHLNDVGTLFKILIKDGDEVRDISTMTVKELLFKKPCGTLLTKTASFLTDGTDGYITYTTIADDLDEAGLWQIQAHLEGVSLDIHSDVAFFRVYPNL